SGQALRPTLPPVAARAQLLVAQVARMLAQRPRVGVRGDHRPLSHTQHVPSFSILAVFGGGVEARQRGLVARWWSATLVAAMPPAVQAEQERQRQARPRRWGRPPQSVVTGYPIGDDSTVAKPRGKKMQGIGRQYSTTAGTHVRGHSLVQGLYVLLGRRCPLAPQLYQQQAVCQAAGVPFCSKLDLMVELVQRFVPVSGTRTHVLAASWYAAKRLWRAA